MERSQVLSELNRIMADVLDDPSVELTHESTAGDIPGWDSMTHITFIVAVERHFGVKFRTGEIEDLHTIGDLLALIEARRPDGGSTRPG